jgi:hypothetical protein
MSARWIALLGAAAGTVALALFALARSGVSPAPGSASLPPGAEAEVRSLRAEVTRLETALVRAQEQAHALEEEAGWLREELDDLRAGAPVDGEAGDARGAADVVFDEAALLAAGFDPEDLEALRERLDAIALERLYLQDAALREGWRGTRRWREEHLALDAAFYGLREEFGEELFDWGLYASERPNRVQVRSVLRGSAAEKAGIEAGDVIVAYDDQRIFRGRDLLAAVKSGRAGQSTELRLLRDGSAHRVFVPGGPLGVRFEPTVMRPPLR